MATAEIIFEDTENGVMVAINFTDPLPDDPADASEAQMSALIAFQSFIGVVEDDESIDMPGDEEIFDAEV